MSEKPIQSLTDPTMLDMPCPPDWARIHWQVALIEGATDQEIENAANKSKALLLNKTITYRDWWHILWACRRLIGKNFTFLAARPVTMQTLGLFGEAIRYSASFFDALYSIEDWSQTHEPVNTFIRLRQHQDNEWYLTGDYPLNEWVRLMFAVSAAKIAVDLYECLLMKPYPGKVKLNCLNESVSPRIIQSVFPNGVEYDYTLEGAWQIQIPTEDVFAKLANDDPTRYMAAMRAFKQEVAPPMPTTTERVQAIQYTSTTVLSTDQVADRLHMTRRQLEKRLREEKTTCKQIVDHMAYMKFKELEPHFTISEITRRMGFVDTRGLKRLINAFEGDQKSTSEPELKLVAK